MFNQREFLMATLAAAALRPSLSFAVDVVSSDYPGLLLTRLTCGATYAGHAALAALGSEGWLDDQLSRPARDPAVDPQLATLRLRIQCDAGDEGNGHPCQSGQYLSAAPFRPLPRTHGLLARPRPPATGCGCRRAKRIRPPPAVERLGRHRPRLRGRGARPWPRARGGRLLGQWPGPANATREEGAALAAATDDRQVLAEVLTGHMGLRELAKVFSGLSTNPIGLHS